jgi:predicted MFS family arabinose efflux permease
LKIEYVSSFNYSPLISSVIVCALNGASMPGVIVLSALCDKTHVTNILLVSTLGSAMSVLIFWGLSSSLSLTVVFAVIYGFFAGGFTSTYAGIVKSLREIAPDSEMGNVFGLLSLGRGIGNVISGPLSEALLNQAKIAIDGSHISGYQSGYRMLIIFTGITASLAMCGWAGRVLRLY